MAVRVLDDEAYEIVVEPVVAPLTVGWVTLGVRLDRRLAGELKRLSGLEVSFIRDQPGWHVLASTLPAVAVAELGQQLPSSGSVQLGQAGEVYQSSLLVIGGNGDGKVCALLQRPLRQLLAPFYRLQQAMVVLAALALLACAVVAIYVARVVVHPIRPLLAAAQRIRDGDYGQEIAPAGLRELVPLAQGMACMQGAIAAREREILALAYRDSLTGLYNRAGFLHQLERHLEAAPPRLTLILLDLDRFQVLNEVLGYPAGDAAIRDVAQALSRIVPGVVGELGRLGGDEFAMLLDGDEALVQGVLERLRQLFEQQRLLQGQLVDVRASVGVASYPEHAGTAEDLLRCADEAMHRAKTGKRHLAWFDPGYRSGRAQQLSLLGELKRALERDELVLRLQPKVALDGSPVRSAEVLLAWEHPQRGFLPPNMFIPYAEQTGFIRELTSWLIPHACQAAVMLAAAGYPTRLSVNLSMQDLHSATLPDYIQRSLNEAGLTPQSLCLEITESSMMDEPERVQETLQALDGMGLKLSVDDYGAGYSSLGYLKRLPVSELKIDLGFVVGMVGDRVDATIVHSTIALAHALGCEVVAEGVEDAATAQLLRELGCDYGQGWFYAPPLPLDDYLGWLRARGAAGD